MSAPSYADSPRSPTNYLGQNYRFTPTYIRSRSPTVLDLRPKENQGYYPIGSIWIDTSSPEEIWILTRIFGNSGVTNAQWVLFVSGSVGPLLDFTGGTGTTGTFPVVPAADGHIQLSSTLGTITITGGLNSLNFDLTGGSLGIDSVNVDTSTPPGTDPVLPDGTGQITLEGGATYATGTTTNPIRTNSLAANTIDIQAQLAGSNAAVAAANRFGVAQFDSNQFTVTSGFVQLLGGGEAIDSIAVQTGTSPIVPTAGGQVTINGAVVAAGTNPVRSDGTGANTLAIEVQISQALAASDVTKIGLSNFDSSAFTVNANGFVALSTTGALRTLTGDTGTATPVAGNIQIAGGPGVTTSATGAVVTINSVVFTDTTAATLSVDNGYFATAAGTYPLPVTASQGELIIVVCETAGAVVLDAPALNFIRLGSLLTSSGGTITSTSIGDSVTLRYRLATLTWEAVSIIGTWLVA